MDLLFSTAGRINRKQFWIGFLILLVIGIILGLIAMSLQAGMGTFGQWLGFALSLTILYPAVALSTKRLRDRGRKNINLWLIAFFAPGILSNFAQTTGIGFQTIDLSGIQTSVPTALGSVLIFLGFVAFIAAVVELGIRKGVHAE